MLRVDERAVLQHALLQLEPVGCLVDRDVERGRDRRVRVVGDRQSHVTGGRRVEAGHGVLVRVQHGRGAVGARRPNHQAIEDQITADQVVGRGRKLRHLDRLHVDVGGLELLDLDVPEGHGLVRTMVLDAHEALREVPRWIGAREVVHEGAVEVDLDGLALHHDLVGVPLAHRVERLLDRGRVGALERVDRARGAIRRVRGVDLDLVALVDRDVRIGSGVGEAHEHACVVVRHQLPVEREAVVLELLLLVPQEAQAARGHQRAVRGTSEGTRSRVPPRIEARERAVEQRRVSLVGLDRRANVEGVAHRQSVDVDVAVIALVVADRHGVDACIELHVSARRRPGLPVGESGQGPRPHLLAVDVERHVLDAREGVGAVRVAQVDRVRAGLVDGGREGHACADLLDGVHESGARVAAVLGVDAGGAEQSRLLGLVPAGVRRRDIPRKRVQRVPRLGAPQLLVRRGLEGTRRAHVDHVTRLEALDRHGHGGAVLGHGGVRDEQRLLADLGTAVLGGRSVAPLLEGVRVRDVRRGLLGDGLRVLDLEAALDDAHLLHVEGVFAQGRELLQSIAQLAGLAPVATLAGAADVQRAVRAVDDAVDAHLEARGVTEGSALVLAVDLLEERALHAPVGHVAEQHLPREVAFLDEHRRARRVADLVLRQPQGRRRDGVRVERSGRVRVVVEEPVLLDVNELRARQPCALVVHREDLAVGTEADAVRRAQTARHVRQLAGLTVDRDGGAAVLSRLRVGGRAAVVDRDRQVDVEVLVIVDEAEGELVEVAAVGPLRERGVHVVEAVAVGVGQLGELVTLGDEDRIADDVDAHGVEQVGRDLGRRDVLRTVRLDCPLDQEDLAGLGVGDPAPGAHGSGGAHQ